MKMHDDDGTYRHSNRKDILKAHMGKVLDDLGIKVKGVNFGAWRHTFESLASSAIGCRIEDLRNIDALNRTSARRVRAIVTSRCGRTSSRPLRMSCGNNSGPIASPPSARRLRTCQFPGPCPPQSRLRQFEKPLSR